MTFLDIASNAVARGLPVIPLPPRQKAAKLKNWQNLATTDPQQIDRWNRENPNYNCGAVAKPDGVWMLDADVPKLAERIEQETGEEFPNTFAVESREGRIHYYFLQTDASRAMRNLTKSALKEPLFDAQVDDKYVVFAGSIHPETGRPYKIKNDGNILPAPDWLIGWVKSCRKATNSGPVHGPWQEKIPKGQRNGTLVSLAGSMRRRRMTLDAITAALVAENAARCDPPLPVSEVRQIAQSVSRYEPAQPEPLAPEASCLLLDMPEEVLDGRLGELLKRRMTRFPIAYAWPALVTVASALVPGRTKQRRFNLYTALVGPWHSGKSQAIEAAQGLLRIESPTLLDTMAGSAEGLIRKCKDAAGNPRLFSPDELGHLLEKAQIQHASFAYVLNRAFYTDEFEVLMARGQAVVFNASLSILGGLVSEKFEELFSAVTTGGLYDRFLFGACPGGFAFEYFPFDDSEIEHFAPVPVSVDQNVWIEKAEWHANSPELEPRVAELAIRTAAVCASFDGRSHLTGKDLGPARAFADYQTRIRRLLKPNAGENPEGKVALKILSYLDRFNGRYVSKRTMLQQISAYRFGPSVADRALSVLHANGEIEITKGRPELVRKIADPEKPEQSEQNANEV